MSGAGRPNLEQGTNIAQGKPARQSSTCVYSRHQVNAEDAAMAVNGDIESDQTFSTDRERLPWWEVDLEAPYTIERIVIHNRHAEYRRFCNFTVLLSADGESWTAAFAKCDPKTFLQITVRLRPGHVARHVRIRLDSENWLHLREVEIYGEPAGLAAAAAAEVVMPRQKVVFSVLYNEPAGFMPYLIENYLLHTDTNAYFIINLPHDFVGSLADLPQSGRVFYRTGEARAATGHTLLCAHLDACHFASSNLPAMAYFVPLASNCLFVRRFNLAAVEAQMRHKPFAEWFVPTAVLKTTEKGLTLSNTTDWNFPKIAANRNFLTLASTKLAIDRFVPMQIEGLMAGFEDWLKLANLAGNIRAACEGEGRFPEFPMEETLPASFFCRHSERGYTLACHMLWNPFRTTVNMAQMVMPDWHFPPHIAIVKWFERDIWHPSSAAALLQTGRAATQIATQAVKRLDMDEISSLAGLFAGLAECLSQLAMQRDSYRIDRY